MSTTTSTPMKMYFFLKLPYLKYPFDKPGDPVKGFKDHESSLEYNLTYLGKRDTGDLLNRSEKEIGDVIQKKIRDSSRLTIDKIDTPPIIETLNT